MLGVNSSLLLVIKAQLCSVISAISLLTWNLESDLHSGCWVTYQTIEDFQETVTW